VETSISYTAPLTKATQDCIEVSCRHFVMLSTQWSSRCCTFRAGCSHGVVSSITPHSPRSIVPLLAWAGAICTQTTHSMLCPLVPQTMLRCFSIPISQHLASRDFILSPYGLGSQDILRQSRMTGEGRRPMPMHSGHWASSCITWQKRLNVGARSSLKVCDYNLWWPRR
jgi:hypothetical protein